MNIAKKPELRSKLLKAADTTTLILKDVFDALHVGVAADELNELTGSLCHKYNVLPSFYGVPGSKNPFNYNLCISVNDVVLHGIPHKSLKFKSADVVKLDFGIIQDQVYTDQCVTVVLEPAKKEDLKLVEVSKMAVLSGVSKAKTGNFTNDIGTTIHALTQMAGFDVLKEFVGHGIGSSLHEPPEVAAYNNPYSNTRLQTGDVICVEAQVVAGSDDVIIAEDGWSVVTKDGKNGAMFEYMVIVGENPENITNTLDWPLAKE